MLSTILLVLLFVIFGASYHNAAKFDDTGIRKYYVRVVWLTGTLALWSLAEMGDSLYRHQWVVAGLFALLSGWWVLRFKTRLNGLKLLGKENVSALPI